MKKMNIRQIGIVTLVLMLITAATTGCSQLMTIGQKTPAGLESNTSGYTGALSTTHENALDPISQLALGILQLETTTDAVTEEQAIKLLPLWELLVGSTVTNDNERLAVAKQIETTLTEAQITAIAAMQLTAADMQVGAGDPPNMEMGTDGGQQPTGGSGQGSSGARGGAGQNMSEEDRAAMRAQFQNMSEEERANMRSQFAQQNSTGGVMPAAVGGSSQNLIARVVALLTERSGKALTASTAPIRTRTTPTPEPEPTQVAPTSTPPAPTPTPTLEPTATLTPTITPVVTETVASTPALTPKPTTAATVRTSANATAAPANTSEATKTTPTLDTTVSEETSSSTIIQSALEWIPDTDPGPPFAIEVTTNYAVSNPNYEGGLIYKVAGVVRNTSDQMYSISAIHVTFYDADGFRGAFVAFPSRGGRGRPTGEYIWHGRVEAEYACLLIAPGEACPFTVEIAAQNMASFLIHPDASLAEWHVSVPVETSDVELYDDGSGYIHIKGTASNNNPYNIKNVVISGVLLDAAGQTVSMGSTYILTLEAGAATAFDVPIQKEAFVDYKLYPQAEQVAN